MTLSKFDRISIGVTVLIFAIGLAAWTQVPAGREIAIHFNGDGHADGWSRAGIALFLVPACAVFCLALQLALPYVDPRGDNLRRSVRAYGTIWLAVMAALVVVQGVVVASALGINILVHGFAPAFAGAMFIVVGNVLGKLRWNMTVGIRTPWTIADERVWDQTHRFGGRLFVACGALLLLAAFALPAQARPGPLILAAAMIVAIGSTLKSWLAWKARTTIVR